MRGRWAVPAGRLVAAAVMALLLAGCGAAAAPGTDARPSPTGDEEDGTRPGEAAPYADAATRRALTRLLDDPDAMLGYTEFDGLARSVTSLRACGGPDGTCEMAVLLTDDRWTSGVTHYLGWQDTIPWTQLLPDGSAAVIPDDPADAVVLHVDGSTTPLTVSLDPVATSGTSLVTGGPLLPDMDGELFGQLWVVDPAGPTVAPLATQPPDGATGPLPTHTDAGALVVLQGARQRSLATSRDNGRTWSSTSLPAPTDGQPGALAGLVAGPGSRLAFSYSYDGATLAPWRDLWLSDDTGGHWHHVGAPHHPRTVGGQAFGPDGTLLLTDDQQGTLWRVTADGDDLEPVPGTPAAVTVRRTGGVVVTEGVGRALSVTDDGVTWWTASPGRGFVIEESRAGGAPVRIDP